MPRRVPACLLVAATLITASCAAGRGASTRPTPASATAKTEVRDSHENLNAVLWMQQAAEYEMVAEGTYARAAALLRAGLAKARTDPSWSAAPEQRGGDYSRLPPAVVMDLDETVLDNTPVQGRQVLLNEVEFNRDTWPLWVAREQAAAIPGAIEFIRDARRDAAVIFVTNRTAAEEAATRGNLKRLGLDVGPEDVLSAGETDPGGQAWSGDRADKTYRRAFLATRYRILLLVGDDLGDFVAISGKSPDERRTIAREFRDYWTDRWVVLPNPTYGSWERATYTKGVTDRDRLAAKRRLVRGFQVP